MNTYEIIAIAAGFLACGCLGAMFVLYCSNRELQREQIKRLENAGRVAIKRLDVANKKLVDKTDEFQRITREASDANNSHATKLVEIESWVAAVDERVASLTGNMTAGSSRSVWPKNPRTTDE